MCTHQFRDCKIFECWGMHFQTFSCSCVAKKCYYADTYVPLMFFVKCNAIFQVTMGSWQLQDTILNQIGWCNQFNWFQKNVMEKEGRFQYGILPLPVDSLFNSKHFLQELRGKYSYFDLCRFSKSRNH